MTASCMDISDREHPTVIEPVRDTRTSRSGTRRRSTTTAPRSSSPTSSAAAARPTCNPAIGPTRGADAIYDIVGRRSRKLDFKQLLQDPAHQTDTENCVAHNGSLIPVEGSDIMVQAWYQGGISVCDFTDSANPRRSPTSTAGRSPRTLVARRLVVGVLLQRLHLLQRHPEGPRRPRRPADPRKAKTVRMDVFNAQSQPSYNG